MQNSDHFVRDSLLEGAADAQRRKGMIPTVVDNTTYLTQVLEHMDSRTAVAKPKQKTAPTSDTKKPGAFQRELEKRAARLGLPAPENYEVTRKDVPLALGGPAWVKKQVSTAERRMRKRVRMLQTLPDWRDKFKRINPLALQGTLGEEKRKEADALVRKILVAADEKFGPWWKPAAKPLWFTGSGKR